jgi:hypothetical protein
MPGFSFPPVGPLGIGSPPFRPSNYFGHRYYDPLRLPLLHFGSLRISLDSQYLALSRFRSSLAFRGEEFTRQRLASFVYRFAYPGALRKEMVVLSSSQVTPVCTCPARRLRWCPLGSPCRLQDYCLPLSIKRRLSPALAGLSSRTTKIKFSELSHAACTLATPGFTHTFTGYACRFATELAAHLFLWELHG